MSRRAKRDEQGRFQVGTVGGPGRPKRQTEAAYMAAMLEEVPLDTWKAVVRSAVDAAKKGDHRARHWLARYLIGEPTIQAPAPVEVIVQQLLQRDLALEQAAHILAKPEVGHALYPVLAVDEEVIRELESEAAAAIQAAEVSRAKTAVGRGG